MIHIPALLRLRDQFDTVALCDRVPDLAREVSLISNRSLLFIR